MQIHNISFLITKWCSIFTLLIGGMVLVSWHVHFVPLIQIHSSHAPMQYNTAFCFILAAIALFHVNCNKRKIVVMVCALIIALFSGLTLLEYGFNLDFGIDRLFIKPFFFSTALYPGRMAPITSCGVLTMALMLLSFYLPGSELRFFFMRLGAALVLIFGLVPFAGYLTGVQLAYSLGQITGMALQSAVSFILMGIGASAYLWQIEKLKVGNALAIWLSTLLSISMVLFSIALWQQNVHQERDLVQSKVAEEASLIEHRLRDEMSYSVLAIRRMGQRWNVRGGTPEAEWRRDALNYIEDIYALRTIEWINKEYHIIWAEPLEENRLVENKSILINRETISLLNIDKGNSPLVMTSPINLVQGYRAIIVYYPLHVAGKPDGYIAGIFDASKLVDQVMPTQTDALFDIKLMDGDKLIYSSTFNSVFDENAYKSEFDVANKQWILLLKPKPIFFQQNLSFIPYVELIGGILFSLLLGSTLYYAITAIQRNKLLVEKSEALYKSEKYQQQLVNAIHEYAIFRIDVKGVVETWNRGAERIKGYTSTEILGRNFSLFFCETDRNAGLPQKALKIAAAKGKYTLERWSRRRDGTLYWVVSTVGRIKNLAGELVGFVVISQDISERRYLELEHQKLIAIIEDSTDFIGVSDLDGNLMYHNRSAKRMVGLPEDADLSQMKIANMHPDWAYTLVHEQGIPSAFLHGTWTAETALFNRVTGQEVPVLQTLTLHRDKQGNPVCLTTVMRDITEHKNAEMALKNSEETFRTSMEDAAIGLALISAQGKLTKVNKALCQMVGYTAEELVQIDIHVITHPEDLKKDTELIKQLLAQKIDTFQVEKRYFHKDGHIIWTVINTTLVRDINDAPKYFIAQIQDINERKRAEEAQENLISKLANSNMELERFAYVASHDMQEPLRMVVCFSEILANEYGNRFNDDAKEYLNIVYDSGKRMQEMLQDLLEYSRVSNDAHILKEVDGALALEHAFDSLQMYIQDSNAKITFDVLPKFLGNRIQFTRLLQNLISNGIKYQAPGATPHIHIGVQSQNNLWCISIRDNGIGIPKEFREQIFHPFRRLHSWDAIKGTGLGLAICKKIVDNFGGGIWVEPAPDVGSVFYLTIPKIQEPVDHFYP